jgi:hypothetical protein
LIVAVQVVPVAEFNKALFGSGLSWMWIRFWFCPNPDAESMSRYKYDLPTCLLGETKHLVVHMSFVVSFTINVNHFYKIMCEPKKLIQKALGDVPSFISYHYPHNR